MSLKKEIMWKKFFCSFGMCIFAKIEWCEVSKVCQTKWRCQLKVHAWQSEFRRVSWVPRYTFFSRKNIKIKIELNLFHHNDHWQGATCASSQELLPQQPACHSLRHDRGRSLPWGSTTRGLQVWSQNWFRKTFYFWKHVLHVAKIND